MTNIREVVNLFEDIADKHHNINGFTFGQLDEVDIEKLALDKYPLFYLEPQPTTLDKGSITYSFTAYIMQVIREDMADRTTAYNETLLTMQNVLDEFMHSRNTTSRPYILNNSDIVLSTPITCEPFTARFANVVTGWNASISIELNNTNNLCDAPRDVS